MSLAEWDLDAPAGDQPAGAGHAVALVMTLAMGLGGLGFGALAGSTLAPADPARPLPAASLAVLDLYVDASSPAPDADRDALATGKTGASARLGRPVVVLRLETANASAVELQLSGLVLEGVARTSTVRQPLNIRIGGHQSGVVDVSVSPDCTVGVPSAPVRARLLLAGASEVPVATSRQLAGGLCSLLDTELPRGWQAPLQAARIRLLGLDLEVTVADLSGDQVAGILVDDRLLPTVLVGDRLLESSARLEHGRPTVLRLRGPPPCVEDSSAVAVPSALRLLARDSQGLRQQMIIVGPELSRWLRLDCAG
jgi:hypothetical protein